MASLIWPLKKKTKQQTALELAALYWQEDQLSLLAGKPNHEGQFHIRVQAPILYTQNTLNTALRETVQHHKLEGMPCHIVLPSNRYELFMLDPLAVPNEEIHAALRWRLKELITYPIQEACWDFFQIPTQDARHYLLCVIVTQTHWLNEIVSYLTQAGLAVNNISIPPLSLRNLLSRLPHGMQTQGLLYLENQTLKFLISKKETLYLVRQFDSLLPTFSYHLLDDPDYLAELTLFLERSFDYCQTQLHQETVKFLQLTPELAALKSSLDGKLSCELQVLSTKTWLDPRSLIQHIEGNELFSLGALFGQQNVPTNQSLSTTS